MDCAAFRRHHLAYVDDTLPGDLLVAAARHAAECAACAHHDTAVRRGLLLARNLPPLECSSDFPARLEARLHEALAAERAARAAGRAPAGDDWTPGWREVAAARGAWSDWRRGRQAVAAAAVLAAATGAALRWDGPTPAAGAPPVPGPGLMADAVSGQVLAQPFPSFQASFGPGAGGTSAAALTAALTGAAGAVFAALPAAPFRARQLPAFGLTEEPAAAGQAGDMVLDAGELVAPVATGVPVWAAAMLAGELPAAVLPGAGGPSFRLVSDSH